jgi:hypothetical protein
MNPREIEKRIKDLPIRLLPEVLDYIDFLISKHSKGNVGGGAKQEFAFDWQGGLSELKDQFSSVDLQHKSLDWR